MRPPFELSPVHRALVDATYGPLPETATEAQLREVPYLCEQCLGDPPLIKAKRVAEILGKGDTTVGKLKREKKLVSYGGPKQQDDRDFSRRGVLRYQLILLFGDPDAQVAAE
jgi:hypothetical protein